MRAVVLRAVGRPLELEQRPVPAPERGELLLRVRACGVCRTDLHLVDGELPEPTLPVVPGHQVVGEVAGIGRDAVGFAEGARVGVPWLGSTCGNCRFCRSERENLCPRARFTGYQRDGGYAEYCVADARYCFALPDGEPELQQAPLLCAGLIGYRALRLVGDAPRVGFYGFGAAAHILIQVALHEGREVYAFTRPDDEAARTFARELGAVWAGGSDRPPPLELDAAIVFAPVGALVPAALRAIAPGGKVVCAGIHMSDIPSFPYQILWMERSVTSVANLTRADAELFLPLAAEVGVRTSVRSYDLEDAGRALDDLRHGRFQGSAVLVP